MLQLLLLPLASRRGAPERVGRTTRLGLPAEPPRSHENSPMKRTVGLRCTICNHPARPQIDLAIANRGFEAGRRRALRRLTRCGLAARAGAPDRRNTRGGNEKDASVSTNSPTD